jgi:dipeptidyl aminopeptidase/acylaminoacyl peptidase
MGCRCRCPARTRGRTFVCRWAVIALVVAGVWPSAAPAAAGQTAAEPSDGEGDRPIAALFGPPTRALPSLSPDGMRVAWIAPLGPARAEAWIGRVEAEGPVADATRLATIAGEAISLAWTERGTTLVAATRSGDGATRDLLRIDIRSGDVASRLPRGVTSGELLDLREAPEPEALVRSTLPPRDVYRVRLDTGEAEVLLRDGLGADTYGFDAEWNARLAIVAGEDGSRRGWVRAGESATWEHFHDWPPDVAPSIRLLGLTADGLYAHLIDPSWPESAGLAALVRVDLTAAERRPSARVLAASTRWMPHTLVAARGTGEPLAVVASFERELWKALSTAFEEEIAQIRKLRGGDFRLVSRSDDDRLWLIGFSTLVEPDSYWLWDRLQRRGRRLMGARDDLDPARIMSSGGFRVRMRDGLEIPVFVAVPADARGEETPSHPTVVLLRDNPWSRESQLDDRARQWLAARGYLVLSIVARGTTGLSPALAAAGAGGWNSTLPQDVEDVLEWAVTAGFSDGARVALVGDGLGASAALAASAYAPERFVGVAAIDPVLDFRSIRSDAPARERLVRAVGSSDEAVLLRESPSRVAPRLAAPACVAFGAGTSPDDARAFVDELRALGRDPVEIPSANGDRRLDGRDEAALLAIEAFLRERFSARPQPSSRRAAESIESR